MAKTCLITGAGSGIGQATAELLAENGYGVVLWGRREERLAHVARICKERGAIFAEIATVDVRDRSAIEKEVQSRPERYSEIDVLVNNAGLARGLAAFQDADPGDFADMIDTNVMGFLNVMRTILPGMVKRNRGHLVNLGSVAGRWVYPKGHVYCATKAAVHALSQGIRMDLSGTAIRMTEVAPGMVETEFTQVRLGDVERAKAVYQGMVPLNAADVADAILWAVSRPAHVNIQEIVLYPTAQASPTIVARNPGPLANR